MKEDIQWVLESLR